ncbi:general secretion pathway protein GspB [Marinobacter sp.]|uniref:general secretion pathway protein GspB n=1 Tax=Marinobacter sp. TaxID=50741 RepID=UPI00356B1E71
MSYILDALRKSETERRQGRVPDLGQQVQLIHRPKKKRVSPAVWVALALVLNAGVLAFLFWPGKPFPWASGGQPEQPATADRVEEAAEPPRVVPVTEPEAVPEDPVDESGATSEPVLADSTVPPIVSERPVPERRERATVIVPSSAIPETAIAMTNQEQAGRVPHLVELPLSFQKSVPDLTFNSHIYSSSPGSRRVMINNAYLRVGDTFEGLRVEDITEDGVVLSRDGRRFRVGVVRDWVSPR